MRTNWSVGSLAEESPQAEVSRRIVSEKIQQNFLEVFILDEEKSDPDGLVSARLRARVGADICIT